MARDIRRGFDVFKIREDVTYSRIGKTVQLKGIDGTNQTTASSGNTLKVRPKTEQF